MKKRLRWCLATVIFVALLGWVEYDLGWGNVFQQWQQASPQQLLLLTLLTLISYVLRAWRIFIIFGQPQQHRFRDYLRISLLHNALNNFLPMRLGEASFPLLMKHHYQQPIVSSSIALLWIRLMDLHWLLLLLGGILCTYAQFLGAGLIIALIVSPLFLPPILTLGKQTLPHKQQKKIENLLASTPELLPLSPRLYGLTMLIWSVKLAALAFILIIFLPIPFTQALLGVITADLSSVLPIHGLAGSGTYEAAMLAALLPFGIDQSLILMAAVNVHIYLLLVTLFSVVPALLIRHQSEKESKNSKAPEHQSH